MFSPATSLHSSSSEEQIVPPLLCKLAVHLLPGSCSHTEPQEPRYHWEPRKLSPHRGSPCEPQMAARQIDAKFQTAWFPQSCSAVFDGGMMAFEEAQDGAGQVRLKTGQCHALGQTERKITHREKQIKTAGKHCAGPRETNQRTVFVGV